MQSDEERELEQLGKELEAKQRHPRAPVRIGYTISQLMARRGYGQTRGREQREAAWRQACGPQLAAQTRVSKLSRGVLTILVANSMTMQELNFQQQAVLARLREIDPDLNVKALRLRVGAIS